MNSEMGQTRRVGCSAAVAVLALGAAACEDPKPPTACGNLPAVTVHVGETATVESCFSDPNGDMLTYSATSSSPQVATAATSGKTVTVTAKALGSATITCVPTWTGWLYLAVVLDAWSRRIVGWAMAPHMKAGLVRAALEMAVRRRQPRGGVVHHSDLSPHVTSLPDHS